MVSYTEAALKNSKRTSTTDCLITVQNHRASITGAYPLHVVRDATSYFVEGFRFSPAYKAKKWDGKKHFFHVPSGHFPAGLVSLVVDGLRAHDKKSRIEVRDITDWPKPAELGFELEGVSFTGKYDYQLLASRALVEGKRGIAKMATNCLSGTTVIDLHRAGRSFKLKLEDLYHKFYGAPVLCSNGLRVSWATHIPTKARYRDEEGYLRLGIIKDVFASGPKQLYKITTNTGRTIEATEDHRFLTEDGMVRLANIRVGQSVYVDGGVLKHEGKKRTYKQCYQMEFHPFSASHFGTGVRVYWSVQTHRLVAEAKMNGMDFDAYVVRVRSGDIQGLQFLDPEKFTAHHIDGDVQNNTPDNIIVVPRVQHLKEHGNVNWRNVTAHTILETVLSIEPTSIAETFDIEMLDDPHNFVANGFIVHNSGKSEVAIAVTKYLGLPTLFLVERISLVHQTRKRFATRLSMPVESIGIVGDSFFELADITVATPTSLLNRIDSPEVQRYLERWKVLFADECHHASSETFYSVMNQCPAPYRYGLSGTPLDRSDGSDMRLLAQTGPVLYEVSNKLLVEREISVPPEVQIIRLDKPALPKSTTWFTVSDTAIVNNRDLNNLVVDKALEHADAGYQVLVLVEKIQHGNNIIQLLKSSKTKHNFVYLTGKESGEKREEVFEEYKKSEVQIMVATTILDEGVDIPNIDVLILAGGGKAKIRLLQRVGRGLRSKQGKERLVVIDFALFCHPWLIKHSLQRLRTYKAEECFDIRMTK